jgi:tetratricopeptide (TPR) repeat protein
MPETFADAVRLHQSGRPEAAAELYLKVLEADPGHVDALHLLGVAEAQAGRPEAAVALIGRALAISPDFALAHVNLGNALRALGRDADAAAAYERAVALDPGQPGARRRLGATWLALARPEDAATALEEALRQQPDDVAALIDLGAAHRACGRLAEALAAYGRAARRQPDRPEGHAGAGAVMHAMGRNAEALDAFRRAVSLAPDDAGAHLGLGVTLQALGRHDEAVAAYHRALALKPDLAEAHVSLAVALQELGQGAEALAATDRALAIDPGQARAWFVRSDLKTFAPGDPDLAAMEARLAAGDALTLDDRLDLEFALGKAWLDAGDAALAFERLAAGNRRMRATYAYDVAADARRFAAIAAAFTPEAIGALAAAGDRSELPVFVVGMPRSGTTLVEQILAAHPAVEGAGELAAFAQAAARVLPAGPPARLASLPPATLAALGRAYLAAVTPLARGKPRLVDKMPANFAFAGLIHLSLPNARIVHCVRDPVDTCLSCYTRKFAGRQPFAYDLAELGAYWRAYDALMAHWRAVLPPDRFIEVRYEAVVADLEGEARRLVAFCGLPWDDACLEFHAARRPVRTASANQVRRPIYAASVARWKPYAAHLGPLLEALGIQAPAIPQARSSPGASPGDPGPPIAG